VSMIDCFDRLMLSHFVILFNSTQYLLLFADKSVQYFFLLKFKALLSRGHDYYCVVTNVVFTFE
jgi:hypothetical protein